MLIEDGSVDEDKLKAELITMEELAAAARKQGFDTLSEVKRCVLEPGGTLSFVARKPATEEVRHAEILKKLDALTAELARLKGTEPQATV